MLSELNQINLSGWKNDPNVSVKVAEVIENASWKKSPFESITGRGSDRAIRTYVVNDSAPYRPRLKSQLGGSGVVGNSDFDSNLDNLEILSQTIYPRVVGNSLKSEISAYSALKHIDFIKEASDSLTEWLTQNRDREIICALSNDFTNAVVCDNTTENNTEGYRLAKNAKESITDLTKEITAKDTMSLKALRRAIFQARSGEKYNKTKAFPIKPVRSDMISTQGITIQHTSYLIFLDSYQINQLKADPEYQDLQKYAGIRGEENALFTGIVGMVDNCPIIDLGTWTDVNVGLLNSEVSDSEFNNHINKQNVTKVTPPSVYKGKENQAVSIGMLVGASACVLVGSQKISFYINENEDAGRKTLCGIDSIRGIAKARYVGEESSPYNNSDYSVIGLFSAKV
ncbi:DUF4043 family protein [Helicobacter cetorum]|uniref:DUF4043 family protein n=1 Tax=Helicobacter cetorum (strain ATCC BAA-429 / MIT 00-7128) TaxID=182217 RepID=I0ELL5_HELC0|nr:DUF4043 family protein [Helicobacter cetorum]AFI03834.1 hypothetical protein HCW_02765 [Helicobacter cetorum MIT 00-7128]